MTPQYQLLVFVPPGLAMVAAWYWLAKTRRLRPLFMAISSAAYTFLTSLVYQTITDASGSGLDHMRASSALAAAIGSMVFLSGRIILGHRPDA